MQKNIVHDEITELYQFCGVSTTNYSMPRNTINTGNLNRYFNHNFHNMLSSDSADRLRWE